MGGKVADIIFTPPELIDRIAALVPPPRTHRHRYFGVLAPNSPLRAQVTAMAQACTHAAPSAAHGFGPLSQPESGAATGAAINGAVAKQPEPAPETPKRFPAHYLWAALIARIYERCSH